MGNKCYEQGFHNDFKNKDVYIATSSKINNYENYYSINNNLAKTITVLNYKEKNLLLFVGGV